MAPNNLDSAVVAEALPRNGPSKSFTPSGKDNVQEKTYKWDIVWFNVLGFVYLYTAALYGMYLFLFNCQWSTFFWSLYLTVIGTLGATAGSHRLWTHNSYKAKLPLRIILAYFQCTCFQNHIYEWVRDHRVHHKYTDTDADPHNASRGFFFSHVGWLMVKKHNDVKEKGKVVYMKDLEADPVVMFQKKYFAILMPLFCFVLPAVIPWYFWGEKFMTAWYVASVFRYMFNVNGVWLVNSACHLYGTRPYDKNILPRQNIYVGYFGFGEGWHNYHHAFPWDYKASEFTGYTANLTTLFIDAFAKIGWAYDLKEVPDEMVKRRMLRTGDGTKKAEVINKKFGSEKIDYESHVWGWGDEDMPVEDQVLIKKFNQLKDRNANLH